MAYYKFEEDDLFLNTVQAYPQNKFYIQSGTVYINNFPNLAGENTTNHIGVPAGFISLYEYNIDRPSNNNIYPFIIKNGSKDGFKKISQTEYNSFPAFDANGNATIMTSSYNMSASLSRFYIVPGSSDGTVFRFLPNTSYQTGSLISSLKNVFNHYSYISPHYQYSSSLGDKSQQYASLITIPSIFYGSKIKKGTVNLKYYITGTLVGELSDFRENGDLVQVGPAGSTGSGSVAGSVLYNEGFIYLTGSWNLDHTVLSYDGSSVKSKWVHFGVGTNKIPDVTLTNTSASFSLEFSGSSQFQTMTMLAHARYGQLNHSNNPTFLSVSDNKPVATGSIQYIEQPKVIKNVVNSNFTDVDPKFEKTTYLSKIAIYDKDKNLIGIAKIATPVRKTEADQYAFKLKLDI